MDLSVRDSAQLLKVSEKTIYRWVKQGKLPAYRINEQYRFNRAELLEWATSQRLNVSADIFVEPDGGGPVVTLTEALKAGGIHYRLSGADKLSVLQSLVEIMPLPEQVDRPFLLQVLLARESLGSTALGGGVAVPHVRNPIVMHILRARWLPFASLKRRLNSGDRRPAGTHPVYDRQPHDPCAPSSAGAVGLRLAAARVCRGNRPTRFARGNSGRQPGRRWEHSAAEIAPRLNHPRGRKKIGRDAAPLVRNPFRHLRYCFHDLLLACGGNPAGRRPARAGRRSQPSGRMPGRSG